MTYLNTGRKLDFKNNSKEMESTMAQFRSNDPHTMVCWIMNE